MVALLLLVVFCVLLRWVGPYLRGPALMIRSVLAWVHRRKVWPALLVLFAILLLPVANADAGIIEWIGEIVADIGEDVSDLALDIFKPVVAAILQAFADLICLLIEQFGPGLIALLELLPPSVLDHAEAVKPYLATANNWAPIFEGMAFFGLYIVFLSFQLPIKLIVKIFVPTVG